MPPSTKIPNFTDKAAQLARQRWRQHRYDAKNRGVSFELSFEDWLNIWLSSGHWHERGTKQGQYCMSRYGDMGPYAIGNVFIQLQSENTKQSHMNRVYSLPSEETRRKMSIAKSGKKRNPCPEYRKELISQGVKQWWKRKKENDRT